MSGQDLLAKMIYQYAEHFFDQSNDSAVDLMILCQLMNLKQNTKSSDQNLGLRSEMESEQLTDFENTLDTIIKNNRQQLKGILDLLKKNTD